MFSSKQKIDSSIAKYFITTNRLDLVEKFINLLIQVRKYPDHQGIRQSVNELTRYFQTTFIAPEYQKKYIAELKALQDSRHQDRWVAYQLHTGLSVLLNTSLQDSSKFEINYCILKNLYRLLCVYNLSEIDVKNYLLTAFRNRGNQSSITTTGQAVFNTTFHRLKKNKIESLFFAMGLDDLYLFSNQVMHQLPPEIEQKNKTTRFKQLMNLIQEILIDNAFDIQAYNQAAVFKHCLAKTTQEISQAPYNLFQYSVKMDQNTAFTLFDRVHFIKILAFVELDDSSYCLVIKALRLELSDNVENKQYIETVFKPIVMAALDYNLERLAQLLNDLIVDENSMLSSLIVDWLNQYPHTNATKLFLLEAFDELRFDYDEDEDEDQEIQNTVSKVLDRAFFDVPEILSASGKRALKNSPQQVPAQSKHKLLTLSYVASSSNSSSQQRKQRHSSNSPRYPSSSNDIQMFGGTLSRGSKVQSGKQSESSSSSFRETHSADGNNQPIATRAQPSASSKRALDVAPQPIEKRVKRTISASRGSAESVAPIGQLTDYFPDFSLHSTFIEQLPINTQIVSHARGFHFYRCNTNQKAYYLVTDDRRKEELKKEIDTQLLSDLHSPVVVDLNSDDANIVVLQSIKKLSETPCVGYPTKLHYMQEVYSNTFDRLNRTLSQAETFAEYPYRHHPFVSFGDEIIHAARYGFGQKVTGDRFQDRLRPVYYEDGSLENFFVGQLWIILQPWENYLALGKFHIISEHAKGNMSISDRIINERETSFWSTVSSHSIALRVPLIIPSFYGEYQPIYQEAFGINQGQFKNFKNKLIQSFKQDSGKNSQRKFSKQIKNEIIDHVIQHYNSAIIFNVKSALSKKGSTLVYHGLTDQPVPALPSIDAARLLHIYHKHPQEIDELLDNMTTWVGGHLSHLDGDQKVSRCIRLLVSVNSEGASFSVRKDIVAQLREYTVASERSQLLKLLDFIECPENKTKIILLFRNEEEYKLHQARQSIEVEYENIQLLMKMPVELVELFLITVKQSSSADIIFNRFLSITKILQERFIFFANDFKELLNNHFKEKVDSVISTMGLLRRKIEDYNLFEPINRESQLTIALPMGIPASSSDTVIPRQSISTVGAAFNIHATLAELINSTMSSGKNRLEIAVKNSDYSNVKKYIMLADDVKDADGNTLLHLAARTGHPDVIQEVLSKVTSRIEKNNAGLTPVHIACYTGKLAVFEVIYNDSITLNESHLRETLRNETSSDESKREIINFMFAKGIDVSAAELQLLSFHATPSVKALLKHIYALFIGIKDYIKVATISTRNPMLHKDISAVSSEIQVIIKKIPSKLIKLIMKRMDSLQGASLISLLGQSGNNGLSTAAIAMIITRVHQEIPNRGRINAVIAAVIMGDLIFIKKMSQLNINFNLTPNHRNTLNKKTVKKPIIFAIQFARHEIFSFISQLNVAGDERAHSEEQILSKSVELCQTSSQHLLVLFDRSEVLQTKYREFYQELTTYCQEITSIGVLLCSKINTEGASNYSITVSSNSSSLFHSTFSDSKQSVATEGAVPSV